MSLNEPAVKRDTFGGDVVNALLLRPPYRKPKEKPVTSKEEVQVAAARLKETLDQRLGREELEEPSYMMFARSNVRDGLMTSPAIVRALLDRIDRLERSQS